MSILFSAKEAFYKAIYQLVTTFIDFKEVRMVHLDPKKQVFELELLSSNPKLFPHLGIYAGRYQLIEDSVLSLITINR
jgi:4'-phosphopantetheinyl transferase EntD